MVVAYVVALVVKALRETTRLAALGHSAMQSRVILHVGDPQASPSGNATALDELLALNIRWTDHNLGCKQNVHLVASGEFDQALKQECFDLPPEGQAAGLSVWDVWGSSHDVVHLGAYTARKPEPPRSALTQSESPETPSLTAVPSFNQGFEEFYRDHFRLVHNVINARAQDRTLAADVTDQAMMIAYRKWDDLSEHPNPVGFVITTARHVLLRVQHKQATKSPPGQLLSLDALPYQQQPSPGIDPADIVSLRLDLDQALRTLPPDQRECFVLHHILDHPIRTIAAQLNIPEGTAKTRVRAARLALRELLGDTAIGGETE
jgi:RNA polymerase sigma-70 factor (ECF subfamily)